MSNERTFHTETGAAPAQISTIAIFYENITSNEIDVERVELTKNGDVDLEYSPTDTDGLSVTEANEKVGGEVGMIVGSYAGAQAEPDFDELEDLNVLVNTPEGMGSWYLEKEHVEKYNSGQWSQEQLFQAVLDTLTEVK